MKKMILLICHCGLLLCGKVSGQPVSGWQLERMPDDLETDFALSALPAHLRAGATVYLLDPVKGYYPGKKGDNGFICFISRTDWEWAEFRKDLITPISFDPEGARAIFPVYRDVAAMRASGKFTPVQIRDTVANRIRRGVYKAPGKAGISFMLAPVMRVYTGMPGDRTVMTMSMPHYMFYAPYVSAAETGTNMPSPTGPFLSNPGNTVLGAGKGPFGYFIMAAGDAVTAKIRTDGSELVKRLAAYSPLFRLDAAGMRH